MITIKATNYRRWHMVYFIVTLGGLCLFLLIIHGFENKNLLEFIGGILLAFLLVYLLSRIDNSKIEYNLSIDWLPNELVLEYQNKQIKIPYIEIKEVRKREVWLSKECYPSMYKLVIITRYKRYRYFTTLVDSEKYYPFEKTQFYEIYQEFKRRGIKLG